MSYENHSPSQQMSLLHSCQTGVNSFILVGLERAENFEQALLLEFGRGFKYTRPLKLNIMDLDYELLEELVSFDQWFVNYFFIIGDMNILHKIIFPTQDNIAERECCGVPCKCTGHRGDRGAVGQPGLKGSPGLPGSQGHPGDEGGPVRSNLHSQNEPQHESNLSRLFSFYS